MKTSNDKLPSAAPETRNSYITLPFQNHKISRESGQRFRIHNIPARDGIITRQLRSEIAVP